MREPVRDKERLEHIKDAIERIQDNIKTEYLDNLSRNVLAYSALQVEHLLFPFVDTNPIDSSLVRYPLPMHFEHVITFFPLLLAIVYNLA